MATGYSRQQSYINGDTILAEHTNDEFNLLQTVFDNIAGHNHDGTAGGGAAITTLTDGDLDTYVTTEESPDVDEISFFTGGTKRITFDNLGLLIGNRFRISYNVANDTLDIGVE